MKVIVIVLRLAIRVKIFFDNFDSLGGVNSRINLCSLAKARSISLALIKEEK